MRPSLTRQQADAKLAAVFRCDDYDIRRLEVE